MYDNEQWKSEGNCSRCRRKPYCKKACTACKKSFRRDIANAFAQTEAGRALTVINAHAAYASENSFATRRIDKEGQK